MLPLISVIIINHNREKYLGDAIASILQQTWQNLELLVWDDGSTDNSVVIAHKYAQKDSRIKVISASHQGIAASRQQAISQTTGLYLGWVDSDDILASTALAETANILNHNPEIGFVYTDYIDVDENCKFLNYGHRCQIPYSPQRLLVDFMTFQFRLIRRSVYEQVNGLEGSPNYADDYDLCLRLSEITQVGRVQKPLYYYRQHSHNTSQIHRTQTQISSQKVIEQALKRRKISDKYQIELEPFSNKFILRRKQSWQNFVNSATKIIKSVNWRLIPYILPLVATVSGGLVNAQIIPNNDGTGTNINTNGNTININGGTTSGANLFHSFQEFGLTQGQIANFLSQPNIENILGRITGGNVSIINGLIQVTGSNANLYLINPAGFIFGNNASLNVPAAFTATTANGIGFGEYWLNAFGTNNYSVLLGNPSSFAFTMNQQGTIINSGNLEVGTGQSLNLLGGTVANTGQLSAPGGQITVTSVPGENLVRLSQPGNLLSLEFAPISGQNQLNSPNLSIASLPELLTVGNTGLTANSDGTIQVNGSDTKLPSTPGTTIVSGNINVSGNTGGQVNILGENIGLINTNINASGTNDGGKVLVGGDFQGNGKIPNATNTYVDNQSVISVDSTSSGNGGTSIIWADNSTKFFGNITARGGVNTGNGGFVEISGKNYLTFNGSVDTTAVNGQTGTLLLDPTTLTIIDTPSGSGTFDTSFAGTISAGDPDNGANTISWGRLASLGSAANIDLQATGDITIDAIEGNTSGVTGPGVATLQLLRGRLSLTSTNGAVNFVDTSDTIRTNGGDINISGNSLNLGNLNTSFSNFSGGTDGAGNVTLTANGNITAGDIIAVGTGYATQGANIEVSSTNGNLIQLGNLDTRVNNQISPIGNVNTTADITAGNVTLNTTNPFGSTIRFNTINTQATANNTSDSIQGGSVEIITNGLIQGIGTIEGSGNTIATGAFQSISSTIPTISAIPNAGGTITLQHDGGSGNVPFTVGNTAVTNGVAGTLSRGDQILSSGIFPVLPNGGNATGTPTGITITSVNTPPTINTSSTLSLTIEPNQSQTFTFNSIVTDVNGDNTTVTIDAILAGTLRRGDTVLNAGDTISTSETLTYTPPANTEGTINAFSVRANDGVSVSSPQTLAVNILPGDDSPETPTRPGPCTFQCEQLPGDPPLTTGDPTNPTTTTVLNPNPIPEDKFTDTFTSQLGIPSPQKTVTVSEAAEIAANIEKATGVKPGFVYLSFVPVEINSSAANKQLKATGDGENEQLEIVVITATGNPIRKRVPDVTKAEILKVAKEFRDQIVAPQFRTRRTYLKPAQQLYNWIIKPIDADLQNQGIQNLVFLPDVGLRSTPLAALHDGQGFLIEKYSVGLMPSLSLTNTLYTDIKKSQVLAMGVSQSTQGQEPLPAVPLEITTLINKLWSGKLLLDQQATIENLKSLRRQQPFGIIHLATHADFLSGAVDNSYIQLWENKLRLNQIRELGLNNPQTEMLVLSACRSALGNEEAEIGFAGLAILAGVKTSVASLWAVGDTGTAALMTKFYESLKNAPIRADALRQAQIAMAKGEVYLQDGQLQGIKEVGSLPLPQNSIKEPNQSLAHPYYWAAFTMVGNPW